MRRRQFTAAAVSGLALGWAPGAARALTEADAVAGVRAALERGASAAVGLLGRTDGFFGNPLVRIELPGFLKDAARLLQATGQRRRVDELVLAMNRAAESAVAQARPLLVNAVRGMSVEDALRIVRGGDTSVTDFFSRKTREPLGQQFLPIVSRATEKVSLAAKYDRVAGRAAGLGLVRPEDADLRRYVTARSLDGLYRMIGEEEKKIRRDPLGSGSALLKKVFG